MLFQVHITIDSITQTQKTLFLRLCEMEKVKPLLIELEKGIIINHPMFTCLENAHSLTQVLDNTKKYTVSFINAGFRIERVKVEIDPQQDSSFLNEHNYYEWHCKLKSKDIERHRSTFDRYNAHLSKNTLTEEQKYATIRCYSKEEFYRRVEAIRKMIKNLDIEILKEKFEYCVYDSNINLDKGWA